MDRQSGSVELVRTIEFTPRKPTEAPQAEFRDPETATCVMADISELWSLFDGPLDIEVHMKPGKGGTSSFWENLAAGRAELLRSHLEGRGVPGRMISIKALVGTKGTNNACVFLRLKR